MENNFSNRLKLWIDENFVSQREFAQLFEMNEVTLNGYVKGKRFPGNDFIEKLGVIGCNVHWLFTGEGDMYAHNDNGLYLKEEYNQKQRAIEASRKYSEMMKTEKTIIEEDGKKRITASMPDFAPEEVKAIIDELENDIPDVTDYLENFKKELLGDIETRFEKMLKVAAGRVGLVRKKK